MSIALATICTDGLVVAADKQITMNGYVYYDRKLSAIPYALLSKRVLLGYAGSPETMKRILPQLEQRLCGPTDKSSQEIGQHFQEVLDNTFRGKAKEDHQLLFGFADQGNFCLFQSRDRVIFPVDTWSCVGIGDSSLLRYLGAIFLDGPVHLPVRLAVPICNYIIAQVKKYCPQWCGGDTNLAVLTSDGVAHEQTMSHFVDTVCENIEQLFNQMLTSATMFDLSDEGCLLLIRELRAATQRSAAIFNSFVPPLP